MDSPSVLRIQTWRDSTSKNKFLFCWLNIRVQINLGLQKILKSNCLIIDTFWPLRLRPFQWHHPKSRYCGLNTQFFALFSHFQLKRTLYRKPFQPKVVYLFIPTHEWGNLKFVSISNRSNQLFFKTFFWTPNIQTFLELLRTIAIQKSIIQKDSNLQIRKKKNWKCPTFQLIFINSWHCWKELHFKFKF